MKTNRSGFTLVELLVVITILAIISITAYTSFSGSSDKAKNSTKLGHLASIETGLNAYYQENNSYPMPSVRNTSTNVWGYDSSTGATTTVTFTGSKSGNQILSINGAAIIGGGKVLENSGTNQVGAKGVIDSTVLGKKYLSQELLDPALKDIKVGDSNTFKDYGLGKYIYGVYAKPAAAGSWNTAGTSGQAYNLAATIADDGKGQVTKITGNFDKSSCALCPNSLIGSANTTLADNQYYTGSEVSNSNIAIPYPIAGF